VNPLPDQELLHTLELADGCSWEVTAGDVQAEALVSQLGRAMQMRMTTGAAISRQHKNLRRLFVRTAAHISAPNLHLTPTSNNCNAALCIPNPDNQAGIMFINLVRLSLVMAREAHDRGGILIHGALAERDGRGVILAAPGGTGKSTASSRFPHPWHSLCDDTTLVVRDRHGSYRAHPWPTWSRFLDGGTGGTWNVQRSVPLMGIFFLSRAGDDQVETAGRAQAAGLLTESVKQASMFMAPDLISDEVRSLHLERFDNICVLARAVPAHVLHISLTGAFWHEIERTLGGNPEDSEFQWGRISQPDTSQAAAF
jgi:SynChlorMet cassette protein ScmC